MNATFFVFFVVVVAVLFFFCHRNFCPVVCLYSDTLEFSFLYQYLLAKSLRTSLSLPGCTMCMSLYLVIASSYQLSSWL